jgi:putative ABC transport system permease protein
MSALLQRSSWRYLLRHPWLFGLSILGVALGVAVVVSIDIANDSAENAFRLSAQRVTGNATHQIVGTAGPVDDDIYRQLRVEHAVRPSAPVVQGHVLHEGTNRTLQVLGIDPLADGAFRPYVGGRTSDLDPSTFIAQGPTGFLSPSTADALEISPGDSLQLSVDGHPKSLLIAGLIEPRDDHSRRALENLLLVDIATAQELLEMNGQLSRIDLIIPDSPERAERVSGIENILPAGARLQRSTDHTATVEQMTRAFELNLSALSLLALIVGMFLIYNTMTFSVVQRRTLLGRLRALGVTRRELFAGIVGEAAVIGLLGTIVGLLLGNLLARGLVELVTQTINDLYYVVTVRKLTLSTGTLLKGIGLGLGGTVLTAAAPAYEAATAPVTRVLQRSREESNIRRYIPRLAGTGILLGIAAGVLLLLPGESINLSYVALFLVLLGFTLLTPAFVVAIARGIRPAMSAAFGVLGRMAARGLITSLSRTAVAIAALSIAVAATVGVGVMVDSFRSTVTVWLDYTLQADIYIQPPSVAMRRGGATLDQELVERFQQTPGVAGYHTIRSPEVSSEVGSTDLVAIDLSQRTRRTFQFKEGSAEEAWPAMRTGEDIIISEPYSYRHDLHRGDSLRIHTHGGERAFHIAGVYYDYGSEMGTVLMGRESFGENYQDPGAAGLALYASETTTVDELIDRLQATGRDQQIIIQSNKSLRETSLQIFDRTFTITTVVRLLAIIVAFIGVLTALMALQLERTRELGVLRAIGMTPGQVGGYVSLQTGLMGMTAGILALPLGVLLASVLVFVINKRSFGWTLQFTVTPDILLQAVGLAFVAALVAGAYPAWKMATTRSAEALRQ